MSASNFPDTIRAIQYTGVGGPEVIKLNSVPFPKPGPNEMLIKVLYGGVNFLDINFRRGIYPLPAIPWTAGWEAAGVLESLPSDPEILSDPEFKARQFKVGQIVASVAPVAFAEYITQPWIKVLPVPDGIGPKLAAATSLQGTTALTLVEEAYNAKQDDYCLVHSAAGGLGLLFCQLLSARGVHVIGSVSTKEKAELAKANGAEYTINYKEEDLVKRVKEITNGEGVHGIYDGLGKAAWQDNLEMVRRKGTIVNFGNTTGVIPPFSILDLKAKNIHLVRPDSSQYMVTPREIREYNSLLWKTVKSGELKAVISKEYPFTPEGVGEAQEDQASGRSLGKLVIRIAN
ncbi:related to NADPH2:quinone reductase [Serendipita indica DSM 11827]|uniref:Probable quinone oxidoreductase n=1 Tax=Serendipita indica (strain DSM 11827) TaxID=1109443 RepID=G4TFP5_SERID|nr:related to NADPH2:quinone reductase [Serendipita indica DSM 11827]